MRFLTIETSWPGASPQEIEREIVLEQEEQLQGVEGLVKLSSNCRVSSAEVTLEFEIGTDIDDALARVNTRLQQVREYPLDAGEPVIEASDVGDRPIARFALTPRPPTSQAIAEFQKAHPEVAEFLEPARLASNSALRVFRAPSACSKEWPAFCDLLEGLSRAAVDDQGWQAQLAAVRRWYQPHLERLYDGLDTREADLEQLEQISGRYPTRERFLTELTLDPPSAAGDLAGDPLLDEDYLILSTVHSAKGQEWDSVFVLNVADGNFPSEFAAGKPALIEEERRLLYVAMTRAKQSLSLIAPLRYHVTQQRKDGDKHVYGARSRFMTETLLTTMDKRYEGRPDVRAGQFKVRSDRQIDVAARMREMW